MSFPEPDPSTKAIAIARLDAMKGALEYSYKKGDLVWTCMVRSNGGSVFKRTGVDLGVTIGLVHSDWVPCHAEERQELVARAAKFNVTQVAETEDLFTGIHEPPADRVKLYAHFYDNLVALQKEQPTLSFVKATPMEWVLVLKRGGGHEIRGDGIKKVCNRLSAYMHKLFTEQRDEILMAAKQAGMVLADEKDAPQVPVVVMPSSVPEERPEGVVTRPASRTVSLKVAFVCVLVALASGFVLGSVFG
jgi:hypothetical protein